MLLSCSTLKVMIKAFFFRTGGSSGFLITAIKKGHKISLRTGRHVGACSPFHPLWRGHARTHASKHARLSLSQIKPSIKSNGEHKELKFRESRGKHSASHQKCSKKPTVSQTLLSFDSPGQKRQHFRKTKLKPQSFGWDIRMCSRTGSAGAVCLMSPWRGFTLRNDNKRGSKQELRTKTEEEFFKTKARLLGKKRRMTVKLAGLMVDRKSWAPRDISSSRRHITSSLTSGGNNPADCTSMTTGITRQRLTSPWRLSGRTLSQNDPGDLIIQFSSPFTVIRRKTSEKVHLFPDPLTRPGANPVMPFLVLKSNFDQNAATGVVTETDLRDRLKANKHRPALKSDRLVNSSAAFCRDTLLCWKNMLASKQTNKQKHF